MEPKTIQLVQESFEKVRPKALTTSETFYTKLFELDPKLKPLFHFENEEAMLTHANKLMRMLSSAVASLNNLEILTPMLETLGRRHVEYKVKSTDYDMFGTALIAALSEELKDDFTLSEEIAWSKVYQAIVKIMKQSIYQN